MSRSYYPTTSAPLFRYASTVFGKFGAKTAFGPETAPGGKAGCGPKTVPCAKAGFGAKAGGDAKAGGGVKPLVQSKVSTPRRYETVTPKAAPGGNYISFANEFRTFSGSLRPS